jgi:hypothetical protein
MISNAESFVDTSSEPPVRGFLHPAAKPIGDGLVLTHGAGGNSRASLLVEFAEAFAGAGFTVLRCDLPFRQSRPYGPPRPSDAERDRQGLKHAVATMRRLVAGRVFLGGQSYGGRQATMLCAEEPGLVDGLLLTSYPLHPPGKPERLRTQHFPGLRNPALFVQGTRDPFGSIEEVQKALGLIPAKTRLMPIEGVGHDLGFKGKSKREGLASSILAAFQQLLL